MTCRTIIVCGLLLIASCTFALPVEEKSVAATLPGDNEVSDHVLAVLDQESTKELHDQESTEGLQEHATSHPLHCTGWPRGGSGNHEQKCLFGNQLGDGLEYVYNRGRGSNNAACGRNANCWCCRRTAPPTTLRCTGWPPGGRGNDEQKCAHGNRLGDGLEYVYNRGRGSNNAACGKGANCWCCRRTPARAVTPVVIHGRWKYWFTKTDAAAQKYTYTVGVTHAEGSERTKEWSSEVSVEVSAGFSFFGFDTEVSVSSSYSQGASSSISRSTERSVTSTSEIEFTKPGAVWQFDYTVTDSQGKADIQTFDLVTTAHRGQTPCCLPGDSLDANRPYGPCRPGAPCACSASVCRG